ncbi:phage holin family protein [Kribbella sp. NPDC048915]|uniref:phage holin family protein n=1 Tax=Kribbella sp. NPDC048915 TaxID=3155148 RepID=UPI0033E06912
MSERTPVAGGRRAELAGRLGRGVRHRRWYSWLASAALWLVATTLAILLADALLSGFHANLPFGPLGFAVVLGIVGLTLQPLLVAGAARFGWVGVLLLAVVGQASIVLVTAWVLPDVRVDNFWSALVVAWIVGVVGTVVGWLSTAGTDEGFVERLVAAGRRRTAEVDDADVDGVVFVQLDGVPFPVLQMAVTAGTVPTLSRWLRSGSHRLHEWTPKLPATTPASQMGILHGVIDGIPAFRWYDRAGDRILVANRPSDAAVIEADLTTGHGLLVDGGVSISNLFTGDAPEAALTMSARADGGEITRRAVAQFVASPAGLTRGLSRSVSELLRDRFQARRGVRRDVQPRCHRSWSTAALRAVTNGVLRDVNTALVAHHMLRGTRSIYVDYVDYDEVAHHAGVLRPESLEALESVDRVLHQLELIASVAPRRYRFVLLSDHGQAQGTPFADRYGEELAVVVSRLAAADVAVSSTPVEGWGRTRILVDQLASGGGVQGRTMRNAAQAIERRGHDEADLVEAHPGHADHADHADHPELITGGTGTAEATTHETTQRRRSGKAEGDEEFHVFGSGNLGLVYVRGVKERLTARQLDRRYPALVAGLAAHPGVGFVVVLDEVEGPIALGAKGRHRLADGQVEGVDPLAPFGPYAPAFVLRAALRPEAPDIYVNSLVESGTEEVAAFEGLVGCHGGLGGWQDRAFVAVPVDVPFPAERVVGADALHLALKNILRHCGHRVDVPHKSTAG